MQWVRSDERQARAIDRMLDAQAAEGGVRTFEDVVRSDEGGRRAAAPATEQDGLWWETDPRLAGRFRRPPD
jgi:putative copper resistance protein D